jgi:hypothetical protein
MSLPEIALHKVEKPTLRPLSPQWYLNGYSLVTRNTRRKRESKSLEQSWELGVGSRGVYNWETLTIHVDKILPSAL